MALDPTLSTVLISGACAVAASLITILTAKITSHPGEEEALTKRFTALTERLEMERAALEKKILKLEANLADLEVKIIRDDAWAVEVVILAANRGVPIPPRPKFAQFNARPATD